MEYFYNVVRDRLTCYSLNIIISKTAAYLQKLLLDKTNFCNFIYSI